MAEVPPQAYPPPHEAGGETPFDATVSQKGRLRAGGPFTRSLRSLLELSKLLLPSDTPGHLHDDEQRNDRTDGHSQPGKSLEEKCIREQHQINELRQSGLHGGEAD